jgi:hypothetical protein
MGRTQNTITSSCIVRKDGVVKDGQPVFTEQAVSPAEMLMGLYNFLSPDYPKFYKMDNVSKLGWLATEILLKDSFDKTAYHPGETGIILSNSNSSLDTDLRYFKTVSEYPSPSLFVYTLPNIVTGEICIRHGFQGENAFFVFEKFEPAFIASYAGGLLNSGAINACICGWVEILANDYEAVLYLVEKRAKGPVFNAANMIAIYDNATHLITFDSK